MTTNLDLLLKPIGFIESCYKDKFAIPRQPGLVQEAWSKIHLISSIHPDQCLQGLETYSHIWLIFGFHLNTNLRYHAKVHPPRLGGETVGALATRSPHRPNPIGLSLVRLGSISKNVIEVFGADLAEGTPVYDIKPYISEIESIPDAKKGWSGSVEWRGLEVEFISEELIEKIRLWGNEIQQTQILEIIRDTLKQDPRPNIHKKDLKSHVFRLFNADIHFRVEKERQALVFDLRRT
jgi:tRNA-Thr(GGU) m(6)t(6)A37 methyltransferase TsaA